MSEKSEAKRDGSILVKNSGRGMRKGDATKDNLVIDYKEYASSFSLNLKVWRKICSDAMKHGLDAVPVLKVILGVEHKIRLVVIEEDYFNYLQNIERKLAEIDNQA